RVGRNYCRDASPAGAPAQRGARTAQRRCAMKVPGILCGLRGTLIARRPTNYYLALRRLTHAHPDHQ
ncbi:MAG TPA: hypothetical protein VHQ88_15590, partial [Burkholderiales bacterium]|nr:hypothetical protein [Burkholderiales bacterium]